MYGSGGIPETLLLDKEGSVATLTLNRPAVLNCINQPQREALQAALTDLGNDPEVRVIVLAGAGRAFCAGQDQKESATMDEHGASRRIAHYKKLYEIIRGLRKPVIARMHGYVAGAGLQIALLCDVRIAAEGTRLGMTELNVGSAAIYGSTILADLVGVSAMQHLVITSEFIDADRALAIGLVHEVLPTAGIDVRVEALAARLASFNPFGIQHTKAWWEARSEAAFQQSWAEATRVHAANFATGGLSAGARRFIARKQRQ